MIARALAFAALLSVQMALAQPSSSRLWHEEGAWKVTPLPAEGDQMCARTATVGTPSTWGLSESAAGGSLFHYIANGVDWPRGGTIMLQVDGNAPISAPALAVPGTGQLLAPLVLVPQSDVASLIGELGTGHELRVTTSIGTRVFPLAGAAAALADFWRCVAAISTTHTAQIYREHSFSLACPRSPNQPSRASGIAPSALEEPFGAALCHRASFGW